jgi:hypothetical protein
MWFGVALMCVASGCDRVSPATSSTAPPVSAAFATVAPPSTDPFVASFLAANNATFDLQEPPTDIGISAVRAIEIVASRTRGPIKKADAVFGVLHANLGALPPPRAWLVVLVGPGFPPAPGSLASGSQDPAGASFAQAHNLYFVYAFVDATTGTMLMSGGSGPPS